MIVGVYGSSKVQVCDLSTIMLCRVDVVEADQLFVAM